eukprot:TRINITY_DN3350_c0_g6_i1.p1 TRINITY_DN3350_c0_g6~~TRINITY_DN3350_c0_g6_i1.p1  ORF type:complete len:347 (-),score=56.45 TRINITY_DN3350_c0_g6_i1:55-1095(-)
MKRKRMQNSHSYSKKQAIADKSLKNGNHAHPIIQEGTGYVSKGFKVLLNNPKIEEGLGIMSRLYEEHFFTKAISSFSPHFTKPLPISYKFGASAAQHSWMRVEILYEYGGIPLDRLESITIEQIYSLMRQSAKALALLHSLGIIHYDIKPGSMIYNDTKDLLKLIGVDCVFGYDSRDKHKKKAAVRMSKEGRLGSAPFKVFKKGRALGVKEETIESYYWARSFAEILLELFGTKENCIKLRGKGSERILRELQKNFDFIEASNCTEAMMKVAIKDILFSTLETGLNKISVMRDVIRRMAEFEKKKQIMVKYAQVEYDNCRDAINLLMLDQIEQYHCLLYTSDAADE